MTKITILVPDLVMADLRYWVERDKKPISVICRELVEAGVKERGKVMGMTSLIPEMREVIHVELSGFANRTASLLSNIFLEAATTHTLILRSAVMKGLDETQIDQAEAEAHAVAVKKLNVKSEDLNQLKQKLREALR